MSRFAGTAVRRPRPGPSNIQGVAARTHNGAPGFTPGDPHVELFNLAVSGMLADNFYEKGQAQIERIRQLVPQCATDWLVSFVTWLRLDAGMRSAPLVIAAEMAKDGSRERRRKIVNAALQRADEPAEFIAYWGSITLPAGVQRGLSDAMQRLYTERSLLKWDGNDRPWRFGDVIEVVHPKPKDATQKALYRYALDRRRHPHAEIPEELRGIHESRYADRLPESERRRYLERHGIPKLWSWERLAGWLPGGMDAQAWEAAIPNMGLIALVRNLNNFDRAGIGDAARASVESKISDPIRIIESGIMPHQFLTAYHSMETDNWKLVLARCVESALRNLPWFGGDVLIMVDCSGSMDDPVGDGKSRLPLTRSQLAGFMAEALARRFDSATIVPYGNQARGAYTPQKHVPILRAAADKRYAADMGGTYTWLNTVKAYGGQSRVIVITDEQAHDSDTGAIKVPVITWNVAGYRPHHANHGTPNRAFVAGIGDQAFKVLPSLISRSQARWPWEG